MQQWREYYRSHTMTAEEAIAKIHDGDTVVDVIGAAEPQHLFRTLVQEKERFSEKGIEILQGLHQGEMPYAEPDCYPNIRIKSLFAAKSSRPPLQAGRGDRIPIHYCAQPGAFRSGALSFDAAMIQVTPPDENGMVNMGITCDHMKAVVERSPFTIAQVNANMPWVEGDTLVPVDKIDCFVPYDEPIIEMPFISSDDPVAEAIGKHIASLVEDGDCLQMGQGTIPNAILKYLEDKHDLGVHTEVFSDNLIPLIEKGVITGARKEIDKGLVVATFIQGTKDLYDYVDRNPLIRLRSVDYTNAVGTICRLSNMVAINAATEVDLMGQVVADSVGKKIFSGVGGQQDFLRGAEESPGGKPIIALPATAKGGTVSRISAVLAAGTPVTTTRNEVHYVVTEYGIADLFGQTLNERAVRLIDIAAPAFRQRLYQEYLAYQRSCGMEEGLAEYMLRKGYQKDWAVL